MGGKRKEPVIESVCFMYTGNDKQFNSFLKSVIRDYLAVLLQAVIPCLFPSSATTSRK